MRLFLFATIATVLTIGCEKAPTPTTPAVSTSSASVSGTIVFSGVGTNVSSAGTSVRAVGSSTTATVGPTQTFTIANVLPASDVSLEFTGTGLNTVVPIGTVRDTDQIQITLVRTNNVLDLNQTNRLGADGAEVTGRIDSIETATTQFQIGGQTIRTNPATQIIRPDGSMGTFADLNTGLLVTATGSKTAASTMVARVVRAQTAVTDVPITLSGTISNLAGTFLGFTFNLQGRVVKGDSTTAFDSGRSFASLSNGLPVQVLGVNQVGFVQASRISLQ